MGNNTSTLTEASKRGDVGRVRWLLQKMAREGGNINQADHDGWTALHFAAFEGQTEIMKEFLRAGAARNARDKLGRTPLHLAAINGHEDAVKVLCSAGGSGSETMELVDAQDASGMTPMHKAAATGHLGAVNALLLAGASAWPRARDNGTPAHLAAYKGHKDVLKALADHGADLTATDDQGQTPLHQAAAQGHSEAAKLLLLHDGDPQAQDKQGQTPVSLAARGGHSELAGVLARWGPAEHTARPSNLPNTQQAPRFRQQDRWRVGASGPAVLDAPSAPPLPAAGRVPYPSIYGEPAPLPPSQREHLRAPAAAPLPHDFGFQQAAPKQPIGKSSRAQEINDDWGRPEAPQPEEDWGDDMGSPRDKSPRRRIVITKREQRTQPGAGTETRYTQAAPSGAVASLVKEAREQYEAAMAQRGGRAGWKTTGNEGSYDDDDYEEEDRRPMSKDQARTRLADLEAQMDAQQGWVRGGTRTQAQLAAIQDARARQQQMEIEALRHMLDITHVSNKGNAGSSEPPDVLICPITTELFREPMIAADGFTYERDVMEAWLRAGKTRSPMTNEVLANRQLTPNHAARSAAMEWRSAHPGVY